MAGRRGWSGITVTDQFCGAGGSTIGAKRAGLEVRLAMNHWARAVETYNTNNPNTECHHADVSAQDPRRFPSTDVLITSPECTTHSPAGGNRRWKPQPDLFVPHVDDPAMVRSRATMWDVPRFAEYHEYNLIIVENVVEVTRWPLFVTWLQAMLVLGYHHKIVSHNSMHSHPTPQSRDRVYIVFWKKGNRAPDLDIRPKAPCPKCEHVVDARQTWKNGRTVGKYKTQYIFTCPECRTTVVPFYYAALNAIDFSLAAERIGDRARPLKDRTLERIRYGLEKYGNRHLVIRTNMTSGVGTRVRGLDEPHMAQTASWLDGLFAPFLINAQHSDGGPLARGVDDPMSTAAASNRPSLVTPGFLVGCANSDGVGRRVKGLDETLGAVHAGGNNYGFVFNVAGRDSVAPLDRAMPTQETREKFAVALVSPAFIAMHRSNSKATPLDDVMATVCAGTTHHVLISGAAQISLRDADAMRTAGLDSEMMTQGGAPQQALIQNAPFLTSYYGNLQAAGADDPVDTVTVKDRHALVNPAIEVDDCYFRMLQPHEIGRAMAFPDDYTVTGNKRDRVKQYGNAVTPPVMDELVRLAVASLAPETAA
jgi:DNA (cytosine-5)-methyltransferase 1